MREAPVLLRITAYGIIRSLGLHRDAAPVIIRDRWDLNISFGFPRCNGVARSGWTGRVAIQISLTVPSTTFGFKGDVRLLPYYESD